MKTIHLEFTLEEAERIINALDAKAEASRKKIKERAGSCPEAHIDMLNESISKDGDVSYKVWLAARHAGARKVARGPVSPSKFGVQFHHYQSEIESLGAREAKRTSSDSGVSWWVFTGATEAEVLSYIEHNDIAEVRNTSEADCSGKLCSSNADMRRVGNRILVKQSFHLDI